MTERVLFIGGPLHGEVREVTIVTSTFIAPVPTALGQRHAQAIYTPRYLWAPVEAGKPRRMFRVYAHGPNREAEEVVRMCDAAGIAPYAVTRDAS